MSPEIVNMGGVVGQATSFDLTLTGGSPYTYTQTFGNICDVSINNDTATVTITPVASGTLTGSITFDNQATCNITIDVEEPTPTGGLQPTTVTETMNAQDSKTFDFTLVGEYDSETEGIHYTYESSIENPTINIGYTPLYNPDGCRLIIGTDNQTEQAEVGNVYVIARIYDKTTYETLREYTATINLTIQGSEPTPPSVVTVTPSTVSENGVVGQDTSFDLTLSGASTYTYTHTFGNICSVSINDNIATVTITPQTSGTLTGSITFNNEATCDITIDVAEPQPTTTGFEPTEVNTSMANVDTGEFVFTLLSGSYDSSIEKVVFINTPSGSDDFTSSINISEEILSDDRYKLTINSDNQTEHTVSGSVNVYANIFDKANDEYLRQYEATINLTVAG